MEPKPAELGLGDPGVMRGWSVEVVEGNRFRGLLPGGRVPLVSDDAQDARLPGTHERRCLLVDGRRLSLATQAAVVSAMAESNRVPFGEVMEELGRTGMVWPVRLSQVVCGSLLLDGRRVPDAATRLVREVACALRLN